VAVGGGKLDDFAPNAECMKGREDCMVLVCSRALGVVVCDELDMPQRDACKRLLGGLSSGEAGRDRVRSPSLLSFSARIWLIIDRAAAP